MMSRREPQADARVRRDGLPRLGAAAWAADGRGRARRRHSGSSLRAGRGSPWPAARTRACTRPDRLRASRSRAAHRRTVRRRLSTPRCRTTWSRSPRRKLLLTSTPASRPGRGRIATAFEPLRRHSTPGERSRGGAPWTPTRCRRPPSSSSVSTTFAPSRRRTPSTTSSSARVLAGRLGAERRPARLHDHGRQLPAAHGANARRDDARVRVGRAGADRRAPRRQAARRGRAHGSAVGPLSRARRVLSPRTLGVISIAACVFASSSSISTAR